MEKEKMKPFYNTIELSPSELLEAQGRAISQEDRIYKFYSEECSPIGAYDSEWTAWDLKNHVFPEMEITSIRRALFNLEKQGKISRSGWVKGPKGMKCGKYIVFTGKLF